jgi:hypothetical protein
MVFCPKTQKPPANKPACTSDTNCLHFKFLTLDGSDEHNQAPGQVRGRATEGWPVGRDEWERTSQIGRPKITVFIRYAYAGFFVEKPLRSALADAFSKHLPPWQANRNRACQKVCVWVKN